MKQKNADQQKASELLQKLQAAVLSSQQKKDKHIDDPDPDEIEFQNKIAGMLNRVSGGENKSDKSSRTGARKTKAKNADEREPSQTASAASAAPASIQHLTASSDTDPAVSPPPKTENKLPDAVRKLTQDTQDTQDSVVLPSEEPVSASPVSSTSVDDRNPSTGSSGRRKSKATKSADTSKVSAATEPAPSEQKKSASAECPSGASGNADETACSAPVQPELSSSGKTAAEKKSVGTPSGKTDGLSDRPASDSPSAKRLFGQSDGDPVSLNDTQTNQSSSQRSPESVTDRHLTENKPAETTATPVSAATKSETLPGKTLSECEGMILQGADTSVPPVPSSAKPKISQTRTNADASAKPSASSASDKVSGSAANSVASSARPSAASATVKPVADSVQPPAASTAPSMVSPNNKSAIPVAPTRSTTDRGAVSSDLKASANKAPAVSVSVTAEKPKMPTQTDRSPSQISSLSSSPSTPAPGTGTGTPHAEATDLRVFPEHSPNTVMRNTSSKVDTNDSQKRTEPLNTPPEPIVIQPHVSTVQEPIVIKPRQNGSQIQPTKIDPNPRPSVSPSPNERITTEISPQGKADNRPSAADAQASSKKETFGVSPVKHTVSQAASTGKTAPVSSPASVKQTAGGAKGESNQTVPVGEQHERPSLGNSAAADSSGERSVSTESEPTAVSGKMREAGTKSAPAATVKNTARTTGESNQTGKPSSKAVGREDKRTATQPGVSLPHLHSTSKIKPSKKRPSRINRTPIASLPEDDNLDEALDEIVTEESPVEVLPVEEPEVLQTKKRSVFTLMKEKKEQKAEQAMSAIALIGKKTNMSEDDIALIFELGYENELGRLVGYETLKKLKFDHIRRSQGADGKQYRTAFGYRNPAFTGGSERRDLVLAHYAHDKKRLMLRMFFTALITLLLIPIDLPGLFGTAFTPYLETSPLLFPILGLLLLCIAGLISLRQIDAGLRSFFCFTPTPYSLVGIFVPLSLLVALLSVSISGGTAVPVNLSAVGALLVCAVCDALRLSDEMRSYRIASGDGTKTVLETAEPRKKKLRYGDKIVKIINDDVDQDLYRVHRTAQVTGFFRRCNDFSGVARPFMLLICTVLVLAFLGSVIGAVATDSFAGALNAFAISLMFTMPVSATVLFFYPLCFANSHLSKHNCTLIGEESVEEYSQPKTVIFNDSDMYAAQKCTQISVREGEDFRQDMRLAGILFRKMSGTLGSVGQNAPMNTADDPPVAFVRLTENGTEAVVDNHYHLLAGNAAFMSKSGVRVPKETTDRALRRAGNVSLMYVAIDGVLKLSYEIEYTVSQSFEEMVSLLAEADTTTAIQTYDPNLNEAFLQTSRTSGAEYVRVIKPGRYEPDTVQDVVDSGAVALGPTFDIARPLLAAASVRNVRMIGFRMQLAATVTGGIAAVLLILNQKLFLPVMAVLFPMLFRCIWLAAAFVLTRLGLRKADDNSDDGGLE